MAERQLMDEWQGMGRGDELQRVQHSSIEMDKLPERARGGIWTLPQREQLRSVAARHSGGLPEAHSARDDEFVEYPRYRPLFVARWWRRMEDETCDHPSNDVRGLSGD